MPALRWMYKCNTSSEASRQSGSSYEDVVNGNMNELDQITDEPHDSETDSDGLRNLNKLFSRRFCASNEELVALANKLLWSLDKLLKFLGHYAGGGGKNERLMRGTK